MEMRKAALRRRMVLASLVSLAATCLFPALGATPGTGAFILRGDGGGPAYSETQYLVFDGQVCTLYDTVMDASGGSSAVYPCHIVSNGNTYQGPGARGLLFTLTLPEGTSSYTCMIEGNSYRCYSPSSDAAKFKLISMFRSYGGSAQPPTALSFSASDQPPRIQMPNPDGTMPPPLPAPAHLPYRITLKGFDCTFQMEGKGTTKCSLTSWNSPHFLSFMVSGAYLEQPQLAVMVQAQQNGDTWYLVPGKFTPYTPLMIAVNQNDMAKVNDLLAQKADVNAHDPDLDPPVALALNNGRMDLVKLLIEHGADVNAKTRDGSTVFLDGLNRTGHDTNAMLAWIDLCTAHGADVNRAGKHGTTPLMQAAIGAQLDAVKALLAHGADVNAAVTIKQEDAVPFIGSGSVTAYDIASKSLQVIDQLGPERAAPGMADNLKAIMALLVQHGAKFLPGTGTPDPTRIHFTAGPGAGSITLVGTRGAAFDGETVTVTNERTGAPAAGPTTKDGSFQVTLPGNAADFYSVRLSNSGKRGDAVYLHGDDPALMVKVDRVAPTTVGGEFVVSGTYTGPANMGIVVGEDTALMYGGKFFAGGYVQPGMSNITVTARTLTGMVYAQQIPLDFTGKAAPRSPLLFQISPPELRTPPYEASFSVRLDGPAKIKTVRISSLGDGKDDIVTSDPAVIGANEAGTGRPGNGAMKHAYTKPGLYQVTATVIDTDGHTYKAQRWLVVPDQDREDRMFSQMWRDLATSLVSGDRDAAMSLQWQDGHNSPDSELDFLSGKGRSILLSTSPLVQDHGYTGMDNYEVKANYYLSAPGLGLFQDKYQITFIRYPDGVWHIDMLRQ